MTSNDFSITIGIPTFNRIDLLRSLLVQLEELPSQLDIKLYNITLLISDNASNDGADEMVEEYSSRLRALGYKFFYFRQTENLGMDGNFRFIYDNSESLYLWYFSDDDILLSENIELLLNDLKTYEPDVCMSNFIQPPYTKNNTVFLFGEQKDNELISNIPAGIASIKKYPKLTNYIIKKIPIDEYKSLIDDCVGDYYLFIVYALLSFSYGRTILVRKSSIAKARVDYMSIQYSPRVFTGLHKSSNKVFKHLNKNEYIDLMVNERKSDDINVALSYLIMHYRKKITFQPQILSNEHLYIRDNWYKILSSPTAAVKYLAFIFYMSCSKIRG